MDSATRVRTFWGLSSYESDEETARKNDVPGYPHGRTRTASRILSLG